VLEATDASASFRAAETCERHAELLGELGARQLEFQATLPESLPRASSCFSELPESRGAAQSGTRWTPQGHETSRSKHPTAGPFLVHCRGRLHAP